jgi:DNA repair protein RadC
MSKNLHAGHRKRVKEKYVKHGIDPFADHELLELLLFYCIPMRDTNEIAHKILREFGTLHNLFEANPLDISRKCKVTENTAILISMIPSLAQRYSLSKWSNRTLLNKPNIAAEFALSIFTGKIIEHFYIFCMDKHRRLLYPALISKGSTSEAPVYPRQIVDIVLKYQAESVILAHNHPHGLPNPSRNDIKSTKLIIKVLEAISVELLDHIIVAGTKHYSFCENKMLNFVY